MISDPLNSRVVLIGTYAFQWLEGLPSVKNNIERLRELLLDAKVWGLPPEHCTSILQPESAADLIDVTKEAAAKATDTFVVYYSGHGLTAPRSLDLCLSLRGSRINEEHTTLPYNWLRQAVLGSKALRKVVILDCCYSARAMSGMSGASEIGQDAEIEGTYLLAAAAETKKALAPPGENYTAFTGELVTVVQEGVTGAGPTLSMDLIYEKVHAALARKARPLPQQRNRNSAAQIALFYNPAKSAEGEQAESSKRDSWESPESGLAHALRHKAEVTGDMSLLDEAILLYRRGLSAVGTDPQAHGYARSRIDLGDALRLRAEKRGDRRSLDESIETLRLATAAAPLGGSDYVISLTALGNALRLRAQETNDSASLQEATEILRAAVAAAPPDMPPRAQAMDSLGETLWGVARLRDDDAELDAAAAAWREAATTASARVRLRIDAARRWGEAIAERRGPAVAADAYRLAVSLLPSLASWQIDLLDQERQLSGYLGLASDAAACYLAKGDVEDAVRMLELGRSVLLNRVVDMNSPDNDLSGIPRHFAEEFDDLRGTLAVEMPDVEGDTAPESSGSAADRRHNAARRLDELIEEIRLEGFTNFLLPPPLSEICMAAVGGPIVVVNVSRYRSDAIVVTADGLSTLPLPSLEPAAVHRHLTEFLSSTNFNGSFHDRVLAQLRMRTTLAWMWIDIVRPIVGHLGLLNRELADSWPRVFWCPTGLLSLLPLHAAGLYGEAESKGEKGSMLDVAVSSYTTTIRSLRRSQSRTYASRAVGGSRFLVTSLTYSRHGHGVSVIPGPDLEARRVLALFPHAQHVSELNATRATVKRELAESDWAHFACHSTTNPDHPINSGLVLADGLLAARDVARIKYRLPPDLVFLSGCGTAQGSTTLADEAVHVASAFQAGGFRHVIGTLWPINDEEAVRYADRFYSALLGGASDPALAVHEATRKFRERLPDSPIVWASVIHLGPSQEHSGEIILGDQAGNVSLSGTLVEIAR